MTVPNLSHGNKGRSYLDNICGVKYAVTNTKENVPYGFKLYKKQKNKQGQVRYIYKNKNSLPFGYTLNNYVSVKNMRLIQHCKKNRQCYREQY